MFSKRIIKSLANSLLIIGILTVYSYDPQPAFAQEEANDSLAKIEIRLGFNGCTPQPPDFWCETIPTLQFTAVGIGAITQVASIQGLLGDETFTCVGVVCDQQLPETSVLGEPLEFWVKYKDGTSGIHHFGQFRVVDVTKLDTAFSFGWRIDLVSSQYDGLYLDCCTGLWEALPPIVDIPIWFINPVSDLDLATENDYYFLAGRLLIHNYSNPGSCLNGGVLPNNYADACGMAAASEEMLLWQNKFDDNILSSAQKVGIPPILLKNLFAEESQIWPGVFGVNQEYGLGHMTEAGADTLLLWNLDYYKSYCIKTLGNSRECHSGYSFLDKEYRAMLRGNLAIDASAYCQTCLNQIDLERVPKTIDIFADALVANAIQMTQIIWNVTQKSPGGISSHEDLWRFTLVNYTAGPGCFHDAVVAAWDGSMLSWESVSNELKDECETAIGYVNNITP